MCYPKPHSKQEDATEVKARPYDFREQLQVGGFRRGKGPGGAFGPGHEGLGQAWRAEGRRDRR